MDSQERRVALVCGHALIHEIEHNIAGRVSGVLVVDTSDIPRGQAVHSDQARQAGVAGSVVVERTLGVAEALTDGINLLGIRDLRHARPRQCSVGMQQAAGSLDRCKNSLSLNSTLHTAYILAACDGRCSGLACTPGRVWASQPTTRRWAKPLRRQPPSAQLRRRVYCALLTPR